MAVINKKLLIFVPTFPVLSETFIQREIAELAKVAKNYSVTVLSLSPGSKPVMADPAVSVLYSRVKPLDILIGLAEIKWLTFGSLFKISLKNKPRGLISNFYLLLKAIGYSHVVKTLCVSHIHAHFLSESSSLMYYVAEFLNLPYSVSAHARDVFATSDDVTKIPELVREKAEKASFIAVCNKKAWEKCVNLVGPDYASKVLLHYHGMDPSVLPIRENTAVETQKFKIVSVGRLVEKKGFTYLIDAGKILKDAGISCEINIIGPGHLYKELTEKITALSLGDTVKVLGEGQGMPNNEVLKYMSESDAFVLPSIETSEGDAEGIPNTLVEAAFLALPIVSTTTGSIPEIVRDGVSGLLVEPNRGDLLAEAIKSLISSSDLRQSLGQTAKLLASDMFDVTKNIVELDHLFSENLA
ncbi:colanic acid biosynthesis glycosyltransferase WcaL [candidate division WWE3 bacterium]|uniref:Colanic acid biosynthesis glycosyltransferase WcaL n=1 Tax=candidate division WWE3 bacterium TaxID=2053526 RepID=A0A7X9DKR1_UNCKA|nr:colanic acid biosynthesis glycosyltransferase WcaL [candidate division WWE3 bacterium]